VAARTRLAGSSARAPLGPIPLAARGLVAVLTRASPAGGDSHRTRPRRSPQRRARLHRHPGQPGIGRGPQLTMRCALTRSADVHAAPPSLLRIAARWRSAGVAGAASAPRSLHRTRPHDSPLRQQSVHRSPLQSECLNEPGRGVMFPAWAGWTLVSLIVLIGVSAMIVHSPASRWMYGAGPRKAARERGGRC
jgi:hypothetical protein